MLKGFHDCGEARNDVKLTTGWDEPPEAQAALSYITSPMPDIVKSKATKEESMLLVLLPLLTGLRQFTPPCDAAFFPLIASELANLRPGELEANTRGFNPQFPFRNLVLLSLKAYNGVDRGCELFSIAACATIPSLKWIVACAVVISLPTQQLATFLDEMRQPVRCPEIFLDNTQIDKLGIETFARAWKADCTIRMSSSSDLSWDESFLPWDHCTITIDPHDRQNITTELRYKDAHDGPGDWAESRRNSTYSVHFNQLLDQEVLRWEHLVD